MAPTNVNGSSRSPTETDWRLKKIRQLEVELRRSKDQLGAISLNNANQLLIITQIYNITSMAQESSPTLAVIKHLIEQSKAHLHATMASSTSFSSTGRGGTVTPPSTSPGSRLSAAVSSDDASLVDSNDNDATPGNKTGGGAGTDEHGTAVQKMGQQDLLGLSPCKLKQKTKEKEEAPKTTKGKHTDGATHAKKQDRDEANDKDSQDESKGEGESDDADDMWQEFSLEEELEGIADAPAKSRAAMRAVLREKEEAHRKRMRESADEKRQIAEKEGLLLRRTFLRPAFQMSSKADVPRAYEQTKQNSNSSSFHSHVVGAPLLKAATAVTVKTVEQTSDAPSPAPTPETGHIDSDLNETSSSSGIISVESTSPKHADRFGIVFDPSKLDAATAAEIGRTGDASDNRRSVLIQSIPNEYSMHKLLAHVRGGAVVMARLVPDTVSIGHGQVAIVTFKTAQEATACKKITAALLARSEENEGHPLDPGSRVSVSLLPTPTYPSRKSVVAAGSTSVGLAPVEEKTRCVFITDFPKHYINDLCTELLFGVSRFPSKMNALEEMWFAGDTLHMQFTGMQEAEKAHRIVSFFHFSKYSGQVHFGADPCAGDVGNIEDLFCDGTIKLASHGFMGLKSILETVGLASYSRSQEKQHMQAQKDKKAALPAVSKMSFSSLLSRTRTSASSRSGGTGTILLPSGARTGPGNVLIDFSFDSAADTNSLTGVPHVQDEFAISRTSTPWTEDLMVGLDLM